MKTLGAFLTALVLTATTGLLFGIFVAFAYNTAKFLGLPI